MLLFVKQQSTMNIILYICTKQVKLGSTGNPVEQILVTCLLGNTGPSVINLQASESLLPNSDSRGFGSTPVFNV